MLKMLLAVGILVYMAASISGAPEPEKTAADKATAVVAAAQPTPAADTTPEPIISDHGFLVLCNTNPEKFVVLDSRGNWVPDVKEVNIRLQIGVDANVVCTSYVGLIAPTNPKELSWKLLEMRSVSSDEFQQVIDNLQDDPAYLQTNGQ